MLVISLESSTADKSSNRGMVTQVAGATRVLAAFPFEEFH